MTSGTYEVFFFALYVSMIVWEHFEAKLPFKVLISFSYSVRFKFFFGWERALSQLLQYSILRLTICYELFIAYPSDNLNIILYTR